MPYQSQKPDSPPANIALDAGRTNRLHTVSLALAALGVIYGDIGTSPLYAVKECFHGLHAIARPRETPDIPKIAKLIQARGINMEMAKTTFYLGRGTILISKKPGMMRWRKSIFSFMSRNSWNAVTSFGIPPDRVMELGSQVEL